MTATHVAETSGLRWRKCLTSLALSVIIIWIHGVLQKLAYGWAPSGCSSGEERVPIVGAKDE